MATTTAIVDVELFGCQIKFRTDVSEFETWQRRATRHILVLHIGRNPAGWETNHRQAKGDAA
jgi:hypothetical protein